MTSIKRLVITAMTVTLSIMLITLCAFGEQKMGASQPPVSDKQMITIIEKPVKVTMKVLDLYNNHYQCELSVVHGKARFRFETELAGVENLDAAIARQRSRTGWKDPYFFVGWERGGGNASRGLLDLVFTIRDGQLVYIGEVVAEETDEPGSVYKEGTFRDIYDKFETNELTCHAGAPIFWLVLEEEDGSFQVNLSRTWEENRPAFFENVKTLRTAEEILYNTVLAKYCQRMIELMQMTHVANSDLDKEELKIFMDILSKVVPGELPKKGVAVRSEMISNDSGLTKTTR